MRKEDDETRLTDLPRMDQALLGAIRTWVTGRQLGEDMGSKIESVFRHLGVNDAASSLEGFLWVLSQGLRRTLMINRTCQNTVAADEARLLSLFFASRARSDQVEAT